MCAVSCHPTRSAAAWAARYSPGFCWLAVCICEVGPCMHLVSGGSSHTGSQALRLSGLQVPVPVPPPQCMGPV